MATSTESARLRVVGQELEQRKITDFEVFVDEDGYRVRGRVPPPPPKIVPPPKWKLGDLFKAKTPAIEPDPNPEPEEWEQRYSRSDIDRLDDSYKARRTKTGVPDDYAVSQVLRVVGAYAEERRWVLTGVNRKRQMIEITHRDAGGQLQTSEQKYAELYDFAMHMYKGRSARA
jgi:hypothetical protein